MNVAVAVLFLFDQISEQLNTTKNFVLILHSAISLSMDLSLEFPIVNRSIFFRHQNLVNVPIAPVGGLLNWLNSSINGFVASGDLLLHLRQYCTVERLCVTQGPSQ